MLLRTLTIRILSLLLLISAGVSKSLLAQEVKIAVQLVPVGSFDAVTKNIQGHWQQKGEQILARNVTLDIVSLKTGNETRDQHMHKDYFESDKYPQAILKRAMGRDGELVAELEVHGVTQRIKGTYKVSGQRVMADFETTLSAFNIKKASYMGVGVQDKVKVTTILPLK